MSRARPRRPRGSGGAQSTAEELQSTPAEIDFAANSVGRARWQPRRASAAEGRRLEERQWGSDWKGKLTNLCWNGEAIKDVVWMLQGAASRRSAGRSRARQRRGGGRSNRRPSLDLRLDRQIKDTAAQMELEGDDLDRGDRRATEEAAAANEEGKGQRPRREEREGPEGDLFFVGRLRRCCWRLEVLRRKGTYCMQANQLMPLRFCSALLELVLGRCITI